jgi:hypothetical protein
MSDEKERTEQQAAATEPSAQDKPLVRAARKSKAPKKKLAKREQSAACKARSSASDARASRSTQGRINRRARPRAGEVRQSEVRPALSRRAQQCA